MAKIMLPRTRSMMMADAHVATSTGGGAAADSGSPAPVVLIKHFNVRWLSSRSQLFVTPKGVGVVSMVYRSLFRQWVYFGQMQTMEQVVQPNRRNGFDFMLTLTFMQKKLSATEKMKVKRKELVLLFEDSEKLRNACELIEHLRKGATDEGSGAASVGGVVSGSSGGGSTPPPLQSPFQEFDLTPEDWQKLTDKAQTKGFPKGVCVAIAGSPVACLHQVTAGQVRVLSHGAAVDSMFALLTEGDLVGDTDFVLSQAHSFTYIAETDVECLTLDVEYLRVLFVQDAQLGGRFFRFLAMGHKKE